MLARAAAMALECASGLLYVVRLASSRSRELHPPMAERCRENAVPVYISLTTEWRERRARYYKQKQLHVSRFVAQLVLRSVA